MAPAGYITTEMMPENIYKQESLDKYLFDMDEYLEAMSGGCECHDDDCDCKK